MNKSKYLIGDVANLIGMSRDTLRHYEKRGLLTARKAANGYRYYTEADISRFISILYQRKMDIGLDDIATLWDEHDSVDSPKRLSDIIRQRLNEEEEAIRNHKRTIARLRMSQKDCENIQKYTGKVMQCTCRLPTSLIRQWTFMMELNNGFSIPGNMQAWITCTCLMNTRSMQKRNLRP